MYGELEIFDDNYNQFEHDGSIEFEIDPDFEDTELDYNRDEEIPY